MHFPLAQLSRMSSLQIVHWVPVHMILSIGEMHWNVIQHLAPPDDSDSFISILLILLCGLAWFYACKFHIGLPISAHGLWEWVMILILFAQLTFDHICKAELNVYNSRGKYLTQCQVLMVFLKGASWGPYILYCCEWPPLTCWLFYRYVCWWLHTVWNWWNCRGVKC